ncbi:MAG TPA: alkaline phosphatase family protein, partial [Bryobacteraceae bacterium]|nr:alkaline phosphatase family protein [Bryobacteraceae bacterium]
MRRILLLPLLAAAVFARQPLTVISVDGLDNRYLADADAMGLKIPNLRRMMREGQAARGVIGVFPTITWPSHTTLI